MYDSWGKVLSTTGTLATTLGKYQPFRYRGYVYDEETGWYYLQSRYYDPTTCRFISADVLLSTGQGVIGHNSFAYCGNNPISRSDPAGCNWFEDAWNWVCDKTKETIKWVDNNVVAPAVSAVQDYLSNYDASYSIGLSVNLSIECVSAHFQPTASFSTDGTIEIQNSYSGGLTLFGSSISLTLNQSACENRSSEKENRGFIQCGYSYCFMAGYVPVIVGNDLILMPDKNTTKKGISASGGIGGSPGLEGHIETGTTKKLLSVNVFRLYKSLHNMIQRW